MRSPRLRAFACAMRRHAMLSVHGSGPRRSTGITHGHTRMRRPIHRRQARVHVLRTPRPVALGRRHRHRHLRPSQASFRCRAARRGAGLPPLCPGLAFRAFGKRLVRQPVLAVRGHGSPVGDERACAAGVRQRQGQGQSHAGASGCRVSRRIRGLPGNPITGPAGPVSRPERVRQERVRQDPGSRRDRARVGKPDRSAGRAAHP